MAGLRVLQVYFESNVHCQHRPLSSSARIRPNPPEPARPPESGRTRKWDGRPNPAELGNGTAARIRLNSNMDVLQNPAELGN